MITHVQPILDLILIESLRPTQMTVGMREVKAKQKAWRAQAEEQGGAFLGLHMIPCVIGPKGRHYIVDHHHLALALALEGVEEVLVMEIADLSHLDKDAFWFVMDARNWMHPFDKEGKRCSPKKLPRSVRNLEDDPFRSIAGELRQNGGYSKDTTPFSEFLWADFLRRRLDLSNIDTDFSGVLKAATELAISKQAHYLPGWCGTSSH